MVHLRTWVLIFGPNILEASSFTLSISPAFPYAGMLNWFITRVYSLIESLWAFMNGL